MSVFELTGRKALVTGGAQGLGEGMAQALAAAGAKVVVADLQEDLGTKVAESLGEGHGFVKLDVTDDANWESAVADATARLGGSTSSSTTPASRSPACSSTSTRPPYASSSRSTCWVRRSASSMDSLPCGRAALPATVARSSTSRRSRRPSRSRHRRLLRDQVWRRTADQGRRDGGREARATAYASTASSRTRPDCHGCWAGQRCRSRSGSLGLLRRLSGLSSSSRLLGGWARFPTWLTLLCSLLLMLLGSSLALGCLLMAAMGDVERHLVFRLRDARFARFSTYRSSLT